VSITIAPPPCPGGTVPCNQNYQGTFNLASYGPPPVAAVIKVRLELKVYSGAVLQSYSTQVSGPWPNQPGAQPWNMVSTDTNLKQHVTATATLLINDVAQANPASVSDYNIAAAGTAASACDAVSARPAEPSAAAARANELIAEAVHGLGIAPPGGYTLRTFGGRYRTDLTDPTVHIRGRVERRDRDHRRVTVSMAPVLVYGAGYWGAALYVPTTADADAHNFLVVEFFAASGVWSDTADVRRLD
jgi:hypothetical protein